MSDKKEDAMNRLVADYIAQSIKLDIYIEFFGLLPSELSNKCEQIAVKELLAIEHDDLVGADKLIDWRQKVMLECTKEARKYRAELMAEFGIDEEKVAVALAEQEEGDAPPKGKMN